MTEHSERNAMRSAWDRYHVIVGLVVAILGAASRAGTDSWLLPVIGITIGLAVAIIPVRSQNA